MTNARHFHRRAADQHHARRRAVSGEHRRGVRAPLESAHWHYAVFSDGGN
jgi:hypothetical protein